MAKKVTPQKSEATANFDDAGDQILTQDQINALVEAEQKEQEETEQKIVAGSPSTGGKRFYSNDIDIDHDLFELMPARMKKNISFSGAPEWIDIVHEHIFHTVDSDGKEQTRCAPVGNHFHQMTVTHQKDGQPIVQCGPPLKEVTTLVNGKAKKQIVPANNVDSHRHVVKYIRSQKVKKRQLNEEAAKLITVEAQKTAPLPGVIG